MSLLIFLLDTFDLFESDSNDNLISSVKTKASTSKYLTQEFDDNHIVHGENLSKN